MQSDTALLETSTAAYVRLECRELRVLHAWFFDFPPQNSPEFSPLSGYSTNGECNSELLFAALMANFVSLGIRPTQKCAKNSTP
jgi:hypothetical protein